MIGGNPFRVYFQVIDRTNSDSVLGFLRGFVATCTEEIGDVSIVLDNHSAHKSRSVKNYAESIGIGMHFLPPYSSVLNPIERWWAMCKHDWARTLSKVERKYDKERLKSDV